MQRRAIFLDDGGVINRNAARGPQWQRLAAEYFVPRRGGASQAWAEANRVIAAAHVGDDFPTALSWAAAGARTAWVRSDGGEAPGVDVALAGPRDLPAALSVVMRSTQASVPTGVAS